MNKSAKILVRASQGIAAVLMLQTLIATFQAAPDAVYLFSLMSIDPWDQLGASLSVATNGLIVLYLNRYYWLSILAYQPGDWLVGAYRLSQHTAEPHFLPN